MEPQLPKLPAELPRARLPEQDATRRQQVNVERHSLLIGLSRFFGVSPACFFDDTETKRGTLPPEVALALRNDAVRDIALRSAGLSAVAGRCRTTFGQQDLTGSIK